MNHLIYRNIFSRISKVLSFCRIVHLRSKYPGMQINGTTYISKNCDIRCVKGSKIVLSNVTISMGCQIIADNGGIIEMNNVFIGPNCVIVSQKSVLINSDCQIAEMVTIRDQNHNFGLKEKTVKEQGFTTYSVQIGKNVWIGAKATVLAGVIVGDNTVIAAHSIINKSCDANALYGGVPAKKIKEF